MSTTSSILGIENQLELIRGASKVLELHVEDSEGVHVNITGSRIVMTVKCQLSDRDPAFQKDSAVGIAEVELTDAPNGIAQIKISPSDTKNLDVGDYVFDIWIVLASGAQHLIVGPSTLTIMAGGTVL